MKKFLILASILAVSSIVFAEEKKIEEQKNEKPDYRSVIVDAWLVRVDADALYKSGVKPLSEKNKENVSIMNLLWCLGEPNNGEVIASARTQSSVNERAECELSEVDNLRREQGGSVLFIPCTFNTAFRSVLWILDNKKIRISYTIRSNYYSILQADSPPKEIKVSFENVLVLSDQKPFIAGLSQIGKDMFFLVLRAEIVE